MADLLHRIINIVIERLSALPPVGTLDATRVITSEEFDSNEPLEPTDVDLRLYYLQLILRILQYSPNNVWPALMNNCKDNQSSQHLYLLQKLTYSGLDLKNPLSNAIVLSKLSLSLLTQRPKGKIGKCNTQLQLDQAALSLLKHLLEGPTSSVIVEQGIEISLLEDLVSSVEQAEHQLQLSLLEVLFIALRLRLSRVDNTNVRRQRPASRDHLKTPSTLSVSTDSDERKLQQSNPITLPPRLLHCLTLGITSPNSRPVLDGWIIFLHQCLPLYGEHIYQVLLRLVECFCNTLLSAFKSVQEIFESDVSNNADTFEPTLGLLLNGLEQSLATAHDRLMTVEVGNAPVKSPEPQQQGFFGTMVSGVFSLETNRARTTTANNRLTVLLCFKDAVRVCFTIWSWGDQSTHSPLQDSSASATFNYTILRLRNRTRRIFEHLFAAEALECLETVIELWQTMTTEESVQSATIFNLLHVLEGTRPRNAIPAIFNAIYSRTNPGALDPMHKSTLTSDLSDTSLAAFLVAYAKSLDDDAMDEIWNDCMTFLKDVLANPMPHRQTLSRLLEFTAILGEKVDNTNFGEQRKMRRELGVSLSTPITTRS